SCASSSVRKRRTAASSGSSQAVAFATCSPAPASTPTRTGPAVNPRPTTTPAPSSSERTTRNDPSERRPIVSWSPPARRIENNVTASDSPRRRSSSVHGASPAASASAVRHTSPPTMQMPVLTIFATSGPTPDTPASGPAATSAVATTARTPTYSSDPCPAAGCRGGGEGTACLGGSVGNSPPLPGGGLGRRWEARFGAARLNGGLVTGRGDRLGAAKQCEKSSSQV